MLKDIVRLVQTNFNEIFRQVFFITFQARWPYFTPLVFTLITCHFMDNIVVMPKGFIEVNMASPTLRKSNHPPPSHSSHVPSSRVSGLQKAAGPIIQPRPHPKTPSGVRVQNHTSHLNGIRGIWGAYHPNRHSLTIFKVPPSKWCATRTAEVIILTRGYPTDNTAPLLHEILDTEQTYPPQHSLK